MQKVRKAEVSLVMITLIWGGTFVSIKTALNYTSPLMLMGLRFFSAFVFFSLFYKVRLKEYTPEVMKKGLLLGVLMFIGYGLQTIGLKYTTASRSGFITYFYALMTPFFQFLILKKKPFLGNLLGLVCAFYGLFLITGGMSRGAFNLGDSVTLLSAVGYSLYIVLLDRIGSDEDVRALTSLQLLVTSLLAFGLIPFFEDPVLTPSPVLWGNLLYLSLLGSVVAVYVMTRYQNAVTPTRAAILYSLEPVSSALLAVLILKDAFSLVQTGGAVLIIGGVLISEILEIKRTSRRSLLNQAE